MTSRRVPVSFPLFLLAWVSLFLHLSLLDWAGARCFVPGHQKHVSNRMQVIERDHLSICVCTCAYKHIYTYTLLLRMCV
jgi:hypothetical protein